MMVFVSDSLWQTKAKWLGFLRVLQSLLHAGQCECRGGVSTIP